MAAWQEHLLLKRSQSRRGSLGANNYQSPRPTSLLGNEPRLKMRKSNVESSGFSATDGQLNHRESGNAKKSKH
jgi:hypothetical protein